MEEVQVRPGSEEPDLPRSLRPDQLALPVSELRRRPLGLTGRGREDDNPSIGEQVAPLEIGFFVDAADRDPGSGAKDLPPSALQRQG
jgi:hypothetical protein